MLRGLLCLMLILILTWVVRPHRWSTSDVWIATHRNHCHRPSVALLHTVHAVHPIHPVHPVHSVHTVHSIHPLYPVGEHVVAESHRWWCHRILHDSSAHLIMLVYSECLG